MKILPQNINKTASCKNCGISFFPRRKLNYGGRHTPVLRRSFSFCSQKCFNWYWNEYNKKIYRLKHPKKDRSHYIIISGKAHKPFNCICIVCGKEFQSIKKDTPYCSDCKWLARKKIKLIPPGDSKYCSKCGLLKSLNSFNHEKKSKDGYKSQCNDCKRDAHALKMRREHERKRAREDPKYRLDRAMKGGMWYALKNKSGKNGCPWESLVGYTLDDLRKHLEKKFLPGMNWDNYGRNIGCWSIDHIIPKSAFNYNSTSDIDFQKCWALKNLRPLWHSDNLSKNAKLNNPFQPSLGF